MFYVYSLYYEERCDGDSIQLTQYLRVVNAYKHSGHVMTTHIALVKCTIHLSVRTVKYY